MNILRTCRERDVPSSHAHPHMSHAPHHSHGSTPSSGSRSKAPSLDRQITVQVQYSTLHYSTLKYSTVQCSTVQITVQDVECLREAFALFDPDKKETLSHEKLGKVKFKLKILILLNSDLMIGHFIYLDIYF